jgi:hypothetical protein
MQKVKNSWNASGKRHATSRGAKEKPRVSQLEMLKPVMQLADDFCQSCSKKRAFGLTHLNDYKLSSAIHLARFGLPDSGRGCVHTCAESSYNSPNHHARYSPTACLNDSTNADDSRTKYDLARTSKYIASPYCAHSTYEAANIVDRGHDACIAVRSCMRPFRGRHTLHICRRIAKRVKKVLVYYHIAKHALIITVEDQDS